MRFSDGVERGIEHGELAVRAAARVGDAELRCRALAAYGLMHFNGGRGIPTAEMEEALSLERSLARVAARRRPDDWSSVTSSSGRRTSTARDRSSTRSAVR